jgi:hypothetical protein
MNQGSPYLKKKKQGYEGQDRETVKYFNNTLILEVKVGK